MKGLKQDGLPSLYVEGNKGGDYLKLTIAGEGMLHVELGHQCVVFVQHVIPIEILTAVLAEALSDGPEKVELPWSEEYNVELRAKVVKGCPHCHKYLDKCAACGRRKKVKS